MICPLTPPPSRCGPALPRGCGPWPLLATLRGPLPKDSQHLRQSAAFAWAQSHRPCNAASGSLNPAAAGRGTSLPAGTHRQEGGAARAVGLRLPDWVRPLGGGAWNLNAGWGWNLDGRRRGWDLFFPGQPGYSGAFSWFFSGLRLQARCFFVRS